MSPVGTINYLSDHACGDSEKRREFGVRVRSRHVANEPNIFLGKVGIPIGRPITALTKQVHRMSNVLFWSYVFEIRGAIICLSSILMIYIEFGRSADESCGHKSMYRMPFPRRRNPAKSNVQIAKASRFRLQYSTCLRSAGGCIPAYPSLIRDGVKSFVAHNRLPCFRYNVFRHVRSFLDRSCLGPHAATTAGWPDYFTGTRRERQSP